MCPLTCHASQLSGAKQNTEETRADNRKLSATLEGVVHAHSQLQQSVEQLQLQLGKRDAQVAELSKEK